MWSYYGSKTNIVDAYPKPIHVKIIEPFAGTARYALKYFDRDILLVDKYDVIVKIWKWLQKCSEKDVLSMPRFAAGDNINHHTYVCEEERFLTGFLVGFGSTGPRKTATPRLRNRPTQQDYTIKQIAAQLWKIRNWKIELGSYENIQNEIATWFIDPPYQVGGHCYKMSNKKIDFSQLAGWCQDRQGQIMVCENSKAKWMDFKPLIQQKNLSGKNQESIWTNTRVSHQGIQLSL